VYTKFHKTMVCIYFTRPHLTPAL